MKQLKYSTRLVAWDMNRVLTKTLRRVDILLLLLPLAAIILWFISLQSINLYHMNDLGLISVLSPLTIIALLMVVIGFCLAIRQQLIRERMLLLHVVLLIFMLYGIAPLVEHIPSISTVYRDAGYTEYITRTRTIAPSLDTYFDWPTFFIFSALITKTSGYQSVLNIAAWTPVFFNLIYLGPLYIILTTATTNKRLLWVGLWFFALTNWIEQDMFVPQGLAFFFYLVIIAILLKWFKVVPAAQLPKPSLLRQHIGRFLPFTSDFYKWLTSTDSLRTSAQPRQRTVLLVVIVLVFLFIVSSHPLTPFFTITSVFVLVVFRRCTPLWLPLLMTLLTAIWLFFMAHPFLVGHLNMVLGDFGNIRSTFSSNVTTRVAQGSPEHTFIVKLRIVITLAVWGLAFLGGVLRLRKGYHDITYILLGVSPFLLILSQSYGGELFLRIYLFTLPVMAFFAAALFFTNSSSTSGLSGWKTAAVAVVSMVLLVGFLFARYGNERMDYKSSAEFNGVRYLYHIAPTNALLLQAWDGTPWIYKNYEKYNTNSLLTTVPDAITSRNIETIVQFIKGQNAPAAYLIFTRSQKATAEMSGVPPGTLDRLENALIASGQFKLVYANPDAQIFQFLEKNKTG